MTKKDLVKNYVLHITGYYSYNGGYYEGSNIYTKVDEKIPLEENNSINALGHEIVISEIYDDSIVINVDNKNSASLECGDKVCVDYYNKSSGSNDFFISDVKELFVSLVKNDSSF
jgi:hypothetical protein